MDEDDFKAQTRQKVITAATGLRNKRAYSQSAHTFLPSVFEHYSYKNSKQIETISLKFKLQKEKLNFHKPVVFLSTIRVTEVTKIMISS